MPGYVLAIDQGTTSTRAILFDSKFDITAISQKEFRQHFPKPGWIEHDPEDIWQTTLATCRAAISQAAIEARDIAAIGIANQRETTVIWERETGKAIYPAIVWQDRRTAQTCADLRDAGHETAVSDKTGLLLDPYFSATKAAWILDHVEGARTAAERGELAFGTIDSFLLWRLTDGRIHATDATNASRTLLYDIAEAGWDEELAELLRVPLPMLPAVHDTAADFGETSLFGAPIKITAMLGDQQAAAIGQACFEPGMTKATYGTGGFILLNTGETRVRSNNRLLTTIAYRLNGKPVYALEGSIFVAGAAVQWLRDGLQIVENAAQTGALAAEADPEQDVFLVPAFVGLGAPHWDADARGALFGLTLGTGRKEIARATLESVCFQTRDLLEAMQGDWQSAGETVLRVDGGMAASDWTMQRLSDITGAAVDRPRIVETTALGVAYIAGMHIGFYPAPDEFAKNWAHEKHFTPGMTQAERETKYAGWQDAVRRTLSR